MKSWPYPRIVAHRGGGKVAPENTLDGIDAGARLGLKMIEFDAKLSADNVVFLLHDDLVDRTSDGHGPAELMRYNEIAKLDAGSWFDPRFKGARMPTLEQVAGRCFQHGLAANIEIKPCGGRDAETGVLVAREAARLWANAEPAPLLSSFSYVALKAAAEAEPDLPRGLLYEAVPAGWRDQTAALACVSLHADHATLNADLVRDIKDSGLRILAYTVNDPARVRELAQWGVDAICTDRIDLIGDGFLV